ncbi:Transmembrane emp24 domain-containing protein 2-like, partial [Globisporangium splendens]
MVARSLLSMGVALLVMTLATVDAFIVEMASYSQECYYEYVRTKRTAFLKIGVLESQDKYDIRLKAYGPFTQPPTEDDMSMNFFDQMVTTERDEQHSNDVQHNGFNFESEHRGGYYKFCLDNTHSAYEGKIVEFYTSFDLSNENDLGHEDEVEKYAKQQHIDDVATSLSRLKDLLELIKSEQLYYKSRERRHRQTLESNNSRIMWWTSLEIGMLALMYVAQSWFLHKWFSDRGMFSKRQWA